MSNFVKCFFHVDLDAFFASVEQINNPALKGKPVIIAGDPHRRRNVVSTASYEARKYGVHSAMPAIRAYELCPNGFFIEPNMKLYSDFSEKVMKLLYDFSPDVLQLSIDEACLDMTGTEKIWGTPIEAANKLKSKILQETGLTISIGIATNSYLAKICSEVNKPNGIYQILPGHEEEFMSKLPLKKIWGIGEKTLTHLNNCGFYTVQDIKSHSKEFLQSFLGNASASFLYNVCRGIEPENFRAKPKSHTLSAETTFEFDIKERNIIEVNLLHLCAQLMERLLRNGLTSFTVHLKIRYEDFSTVSVQQTYDTPLLCTDELYSRILTLFDKKYEFNKSIRLLGIGIQNTIKSTKIIQPELFETSNKKKQTIEKAILELETKHPKIKVHKARLLEKTKILILFFSLTLIFFNKQNIFAQEKFETTRQSENSIQLNNAITDESKLPPKSTPGGTSLFSYQKDDNSIEFFANGFWNLSLLQSSTATFGYNNNFVFDFGTPVFEQEVDLSLWFLLNQHWYVQGAFADKFNKNTFALGYFGDGTVKDVKISNRNIVFPEKYSLTDIGRSIGGGDNQSPGISASFAKDKWTLDAALRYDMLVSFDKTYYGRNSISTVKIPKENFDSGSIFIMPSSQIAANVVAIYVESANGTFTDEANRKYKKLSQNDFLIMPAKNQIILSSSSSAKKINNIKPCVLIEFSSDAQSLFELDGSLGTFGTPDGGGSGYLEKIQRFFGSNLNSIYASEKAKNKIPNVSSYSYSAKLSNISVPDKTGTKTDGFFVQLNSKSMLLAQNSVGFSPFVACYRYDGGIAEAQDVQVASYSTQTKSQIYSAIISENIDTIKTDFFNSKRIYIDVYNPDYSINSTGVTGNISYISPEILFPFADRSPGTYLGYKSETDECVMLKTVAQTSRIDIGTKAVSGTVQVYKNGILDNSAKYNPQTGEIALATGISDSDKIYITWFEESANYQTGMIAGAIGFNYNFFDNLSTDVAIGTRWALSKDLNYAQEDRASSGYITLSSKTKWKEEKIELSNTIGATIQIDNLTNNYKISGMDNAIPSTAYLTQDAAKNLPNDFTPVINSRPSEIDKHIELLSETNCSTQNQTGTLDSSISGYQIPISYNFSNITPLGQDDVYWASNSVLMQSNNSSLPNCSKFSLAIKLSNEFIELAKNNLAKTKIYLQLGVSSKDDFKTENKGNIPTWKIFDSQIDSGLSSNKYYDVEKPLKLDDSFGVANTNWQTVSVCLTDNDRANFTDEHNARIIITTDKTPENPIPAFGTIFIGPYELVSEGIYTTQDSGFSIYTEQLKQVNPAVKKFNKSDNYSQNIFWQIQDFESTIKISDSNIIAQKYFKELDISTYKTINLYFSLDVAGLSKLESQHSISDDNIALTLILDKDAASAQENGEKAIEVKIHSSDLKDFINYDENAASIHIVSSKLHKLEINKTTNEIFIDGIKLKNSTLYINNTVLPTRLKLKVNSILKTSTDDESKLYQFGRFTLDELYLSDTSPKVVLQDQLKTRFSKNGDILKIKNFSLIKDAELLAIGDFISVLNTDSSFANKIDFSGNINANVTLANIKITNQIGRAAESKNTITSASHTIATATPILNIFSFSENFVTNKDDKSATKENSFTINLQKIKIPLILNAQAKTSTDSWSTTQNISDTLQFSLGSKFKYNLQIDTNLNQKINTNNLSTKISTNNYFDTWYDTTKTQFSFGDPNAQKRVINASATNTFSFPFAAFSPQINFKQTGTYSSSSQNLFFDSTSFQTIFPFKIGNQNFSFMYEKSSSLILDTQKGGNYSTDIKNIYNSMSKKDWFFYAFPIYDLISDELAKNVLKTLPSYQAQNMLALNEVSQSVNYNGNYKFSWRRPIFASKYDLFVPTLFTLAFARDITSAENIADTYQAKVSLGYTAINIFSKGGSIPLFNWCKSDEYNISFQTIHKFSKNDSSIYKQLYSTYLQANFYKDNDDVFRTAFQFTFQDENNWSTKTTLLFKRQSNFSPIIEIAKLFKKDLDYSSIKLLRTNSLNFNTYSSQGNSTNATKNEYQSIELSHLVEFILTNEFSLNANISGFFTHQKDKTCSLGYKLGIGSNLKF